MEKIYDVTALGELLIDFTENGISAQGNPLLEANPGGAPCNVLAMLEKLGKKTAFIGKVGKDMFGEQLKTAVEEVGIDTRNLVMDEEVHTTLAFVHTYPDGDRDFSFYRNPGADMMLKKEEVDENLIRGAKIFHFGTLSSTHEGVREATRYAIDVAKEAGCIVSFDPNLRPPLWKSLDEAKVEIEYGLSKCDILKISDNEVEFLFGTTDYDEGARLIREKYQIPLVLITLGKDGSRAYYKDLRVEVPGFVQEHTIETTRRRYVLCQFPELYSGAWNGRADRRKFKRASHICKCGSISDHNKKRGTSGYADQRRNQELYPECIKKESVVRQKRRTSA